MLLHEKLTEWTWTRKTLARDSWGSPVYSRSPRAVSWCLVGRIRTLTHNDGTGDMRTGNYDYQIKINERVIAQGHIQGHDRKEGWTRLIELVAEDGVQAEKQLAENVKEILRRATTQQLDEESTS